MTTTAPENILNDVPQNPHAEQGILGAIILNPMLLDNIGVKLRGEHFHNPRHEVIFETLAIMHEQNAQPGDASMRLLAALAESGDVARVGGAPYLYDLTQGAIPNRDILEENVAIVLNTAGRRELLNLLTKIRQHILSPDADLSNIIGMSEEQLRELAEHFDHRNEQDLKKFGDILEAGVDSFDPNSLIGMARFVWGITELDQATHGLQDSRFVIVAARPGVGKSTLLIEGCKNAFPRRPRKGTLEEEAFKDLLNEDGKLPGRPVLLASLEMSENEIVCNVLASECRVDKGHMAQRKVTDEEMARLGNKLGTLSSAPLHVNANPNQNLRTIRRDAVEMTKKYGEPPLILVDYLQLMTGVTKAENRQQEVSTMSRGLKLLAKELNTPVIAAAQLNRGSEQRTDKRPVISDLRESGSLEQDADIVILIDREDMRDPDSARAGEIDLDLGKNRGGIRKTVTATYMGLYSKICDMSHGEA